MPPTPQRPRPRNDDAGPGYGFFAVTPHDSNTLAKDSRALWVGTGGDLAVTGADGEDCTFVGVPNGTLLPIRVQRVKVTGTTADDIVAIY